MPEGGPIKARRPYARLLATLALCGSISIALAEKEKVELSLTAPANGAVYTAPASVPLSALARAALLPAAAAEHAINNPQAVAQVEFFAGITPIGVVAGPLADNRYSFTWANPTPGIYSITARATNDKGDTALSGVVNIIVNAPPTVSLSSHAPVVTAPGSINLTATPADADGTIQKVDFFRGATLVGTATAAPFSAQLAGLAPGTYSFSARATDNHGATGDSVAVTVILNDPPSVALASAAAVVTAPGTISLTATPTDTDGSIQKVDFFRGSTLLGTATTAPYNLQLADLPAGAYTFTALASDNHSATGSSAALTVRVNAPPTITLSSTATSFRAPANVPLTALALDLDGTIAKVEFFNDSTPITTVTAEPFSVTWGSVPQGTYTLTALVTDDLGASVLSAPVVIIVTAAEAKLYFIHVDHLNTPRLIADEQQRAVWRWDQHEPFGADLPNSDLSASEIFDVPLRLPGQYYDSDTNLLYNYFRDYDPSRGRYLQSDPIGLWGGPNTFEYAYSNPIRFADRFGLAVFICTRAARGMPGNHTYLYDDSSTGRSCGSGGMFGLGSLGKGEPGQAEHACVKIPGSDGAEDQIMNCCYANANNGLWFPFLNDCYSAVDDCLKATGFANPGAPAGRLSSNCSSCMPRYTGDLFVGAP